MLEAKHIVRLFTRMAHLYGHKWASAYGDAVKDGEFTPSAKQWLYDLREYAPEQIAIGLDAIMRKRPEWPPGPIEFMNLCDGVPSVAEVLDRKNDYGPICAAIRGRMDWWTLDLLPAREVRDAAKFGMERAVAAIKREGTYAALVANQREALAAPKTTEGITNAG